MSHQENPRVLLIDNYDSFTFNLYQYLYELGLPGQPFEGLTVEVHRNDALTLQAALDRAPTHIVLSPGPGRPERPRDFGVCAELLDALAPTVPTLGVCLGHQGLCWRLGGQVIKAPKVMHGKTDRIIHTGEGLFADLPHPLTVMRYHSLVVDRASLPDGLTITAENAEGLIMAVAHTEWPLVGVQFHPESVGTPEGHGLLANFLKMRGPGR